MVPTPRDGSIVKTGPDGSHPTGWFYSQIKPDGSHSTGWFYRLTGPDSSHTTGWFYIQKGQDEKNWAAVDLKIQWPALGMFFCRETVLNAVGCLDPT